MEIHQKLKSYIRAQGLTYKFVAQKSGINTKRFYRLINGDSPLDVGEYEKICIGLGMDPGFFFNKCS